MGAALAGSGRAKGTRASGRGRALGLGGGYPGVSSSLAEFTGCCVHVNFKTLFVDELHSSPLKKNKRKEGEKEERE